MSVIRRLFERLRATLFGGFELDGEIPAVDWVIAGLGNPGEQYAGSRHNSGFRVLDRLALLKGASFTGHRFDGLAARVSFCDTMALLVKPQTYYNRSGECVARFVDHYHVTPERLIVVHDEIDLQSPRIRIKRGGGDAGNRGVRSITEVLATPEFIRVRIGVGRPKSDEDARDYVLKPLTDDEKAAFRETADRAARAIEAIIADGLESAMGKFNQRI